MNLAISNIAWAVENDDSVYAFMHQLGFKGLEIAPTRIFPNAPYEQLKDAEKWSHDCRFDIPSMQSIWYGRTENIFCDKERETLYQYTCQAIDFAAAIRCRNLVFGCPRNRQIPGPEYRPQAVSFFQSIADYAERCGCIIGIEANPPIYNTNFINTTNEALELVKDVASPAFMLNLDVGTMIHNNENVDMLREHVRRISHVHISEPYLKLIEMRTLHQQLAALLKDNGYKEFISIEMGKQENLQMIKETMEYVKGVFQ